MAERALALAPGLRIHIVGAGGAGMSGLAKIMAQQGHEVTGSDLKPGPMLDRLNDSGVVTWVGHRPDAVADADLVVASSAVPDGDPEVVAAGAAGTTVWRRPDLLDAITRARPGLGFTGTHGKTTSSAMAVTALRGCGLDPSFVVGGELVDLNTGAHLGDSDIFVLEADEAFGTFRRLHLDALLVTNIEADHLDYYGSVAAMEDAYAQVASRVAGPVVACVDDPGVRRLAQRVPLVGYGLGLSADWRVAELESTDLGMSFTLNGPDSRHRVRVPRPGTHDALNAAGVLSVLGERGDDLDCAVEALAGFAGVRRRFEVKDRVAGVTIIDDYAHHPSEVAATIAAAVTTAERTWVVFQPHRYSRTADLAPGFGAPLAAADRIVVTDVYGAGERPLPGVNGRLVAQAAAASGGDVVYVPQLRDVPDVVGPELRAGDVVLLLGAGDVASIWADLSARVRRDHDG